MIRRSARGVLALLPLLVLPAFVSASSLGTPRAASASPYFCEGEWFTLKVAGFYSNPAYDYKPRASHGVAMHIGGNSSSNKGAGDETHYRIVFSRPFTSAVLSVRYSDAAAGNIVEVYFDSALKGSFTTVATGGWNAFRWHSAAIPLGSIPAGTHTVWFRVKRGGSYGLNLDQFKIEG